MRLGLLTAPFPDTPLMDVADWAAATGFESLEIACWPQSTGPTRRYAGTSHIDVANLSDSQATDIVAAVSAKGLAISGLGYYPNPLHPDPQHRAEVIGHLKHGHRSPRAKMDVPLVNTFMGGDGIQAPGRELGRRRSRSGPTSSSSRTTTGVRITLENCPMLFSLRRVAGRQQHRHDPPSSGAASSSSGAARSGSTSTRRT